MGVRKVDVKVESKIPSQSLFAFLKNNMHRFATFFPESVKSVQVQGGGSVRTGCVTHWNCDIGQPGSLMTMKVKIEEIDEENKYIIMVPLEGDFEKMYKNSRGKIQFYDQENGSSIVKLTVEYEKLSENYPDPDHYINSTIKMFKGMDSYLRAGLS